jgi:hypothetical protein
MLWGCWEVIKMKIRKSVFIVIMLLLIGILISINFSSGFKAGDIVSSEVQAGHVCTTSTSKAIAWDGRCSAVIYSYSDFNTCELGYGNRITEVKILSDCGCNKEDFCNQTNKNCITLNYFYQKERQPNKPYESIFMSRTNEYCKECNENISRNYLEGSINGSKWNSYSDVIQKQNKCAVKDKCGDPCAGISCPEFECYIYDRNGDGQTDGENDWGCRIKNTTKPEDTFSKSIAYSSSSQTSQNKKGSSESCGAEYEKCGKGCCICGRECCFGSFCCNKESQICIGSKVLGKAACSDFNCPEGKKLCSAGEGKKDKSTCCLESEKCVVISKSALGITVNIATCSPKEDCEKPCGESKNKVCCNENQECNLLGGLIPYCQPKEDTSCKEPFPKMCEGINPSDKNGDLPVIRICCPENSECNTTPNGSPYCA